MLDDLKLIHERDQQDTLGIAEKQWQQLTHEFEIEPSVSVNNITNVVYGAMGGSALAAIYALSWPRLEIPFEVVRGYELPNYVNHNTLFIASSYSGNTEETLESINHAASKGAI
jgi:glucose/mannose-6-phosphate isomerase